MDKLKEHKHQIAYTVLIVVVLMLLGRGKQGRYAISSSVASVTVLDTKTSEIWVRGREGNTYLGTNKNPRVEFIPINPKDINKAKGRLTEYKKEKAELKQ